MCKINLNKYQYLVGKTIAVLDGCGTKGICKEVTCDDDRVVLKLDVGNYIAGFPATACKLAA